MTTFASKYLGGIAEVANIGRVVSPCGEKGRKGGGGKWRFSERATTTVVILGEMNRQLLCYRVFQTLTSQPLLASLGAHSLSVTTQVSVSDGGRRLGRSKAFISLICHLYSVSTTPGQVLE